MALYTMWMWWYEICCSQILTKPLIMPLYWCRWNATVYEKWQQNNTMEYDISSSQIRITWSERILFSIYWNPWRRKCLYLFHKSNHKCIFVKCLYYASMSINVLENKSTTRCLHLMKMFYFWRAKNWNALKF